MTDSEKIAALAAALDEMKAERNWYRTAWTEAFRERDRLKTELEHAQNAVTRLIEECDTLRDWYEAVMTDAEEFGVGG